MREKVTENEDQVKLKPILGIRPGVYLAVLYSLIILVVLFFLLVYPGARNPGAVLIVKTEPMDAAIRVDGVYMGTSKDRIPVSKGARTIEAVLPGFITESAVYEIPGRVFASRFFPLPYRLEFVLKTDDPQAALAQAALDYASWSFGGEPTATWQIPLSLSEGAYRAGGRIDVDYAGEILTAAARFAVTRAALRDLVRTKFLLDSGGLSPSPVGLAGSVSDMLVFLSENPGSAQWLASLLPPESASIVRGSAWFRNTAFQAVSPISGSFTTQRFNLAGITFTSIQEGILISDNPVSRSVFETFLNENPEWKDDFTDYLVEEISVNAQGAAGALLQEIADRGIITGITWHSAQALCRWLSNQLPQSMAGMEVRLPTEAEWETSVFQTAALQGATRNMGFPGWEWCADPFAPLQFISASPKAVDAVGSPERVLRGRQPSTATASTRASLPPHLSSPFVTFRLVIAAAD
ncbi:MAG: formylglycine-generating enzyme family protein [Treponema sp.]|jgi:hypothetical protein|nr:formylglycine-generating enzyme family protein [Treponema sp.]